MLISVIVPVYNVEKYINNCVSSIINQTYKELEIILVDDGSLDNSGEMCDGFSKTDSRISVIHKENGGLSDARNVGIDIAKGDCITFIDSDDYISSDMIEKLYNSMMSTNSDICVCGTTYITDDNQKIKQVTIQDKCIVVSENCLEKFFTNNYIGTTAWGKLYKIELFNNVRYPFGRYHEDIFTTYKLIDKCNKISIIDLSGYYYRQSNLSITKSNFKMKHLDSIYGAIERAKYVEENHPELETIAKSTIVYGCQQAMQKLAKNKFVDKTINKKEVLNILQDYYRKYEKYFLKGKSGIKSKIFSLSCYCSTSFGLSLLTLINQNNSKF